MVTTKFTVYLCNESKKKKHNNIVVSYVFIINEHYIYLQIAVSTAAIRINYTVVGPLFYCNIKWYIEAYRVKLTLKSQFNF